MFLAAAPLAALLPLVLTSVTQTAPAEAATSSSCAAVPVPAPAGARIESVQAAAKPAEADVPAYCEITVTLTHGSAGDHVKVAVALPLTGWTGRLQAIGGSAYTAGDFGAPLVQAVKDGYSGVTTDAGVPLTFLDTSWALTDKGEINKPLVTNFSTRSVHEAAVIGKDVTRKFYQRAVSYSYWNGCSTGGRQGYSEAQRYPGDFDGVLANAPAVHWAEFAVATLWPQVVMNQDKTFPPDCVFSAFRQAAIKACDGRDGVTNGIVDRPDECGWLWPGLPKSAEFGPVTKAPGIPVALGWVQTFLKKQPGFDASKITYRQFAELFRQSVREYDDVIGTSDPDLSDFRRAGGKLITFVGTDDQLIPPGGTLRYRREVERELGGPKRVNEFYRLFLAPGVPHCAGGAGAAPTNALGALVDWVEHGKAPSTLPAANSDKTLTRDLCPYPQVSRYRGHGDPAVASSYLCTAH